MKARLWNVRTLFVVSILVYISSQTYGFFYGIRMLNGGGFGGDGVHYADWVMNKLSISDYFHTLSVYHVQRILPGIIVHYMMVFFQLDLHNHTAVIKSFLFFDNVMLAFTILGLFSLARYLKWTLEATFIAFITLVFNFVILKQMYHYTILTDYAAFALGFFQIYFYIKNQNVSLFLISIVGAFVWPTLLVTGLLLLIFKAEMFQKITLNPSVDFYRKTKIWKVLAVIFLLSAISTIIFYFEKQNLYLYLSNYYAQSDLLKSHSLFMPSVFVILLYLSYVVWPFLLLFSKNVLDRKNMNKKLLLNIMIAIGTYLAIAFFVRYVSNPDLANPATFGTFLLRPIYPVLFPGLFFITYIPFFGLGVLLFMFLYTKINFDLISSVAALSMLFMLVFFILEPEPRMAINYFPIVAIVLGAYLSKQKMSLSFCFYYAVLSYLFARAWLPNFYPYELVTPYPHSDLISIPIGVVLLYLLLKKEGLLGKESSKPHDFVTDNEIYEAR